MAASLRFILILEPLDPVGISCLEIEASQKACESFLSGSLQGFISCSQGYLGCCARVCVSARACVYCFQGCLLRIWFWNFYFLLIVFFLKLSNSFFFFFKLEEFFKWIGEKVQTLEWLSLWKNLYFEGEFVLGMNHPVTDICSEIFWKVFRSIPSLYTWGNWGSGRERGFAKAMQQVSGCGGTKMQVLLLEPASGFQEALSHLVYI